MTPAKSKYMATYYQATRQKKLAYQAAYYKKTKVQRRARATAIRRKSMLKLKYGITPEQYIAKWKKQQGRCGICQIKGTKVGRRALHVDHRHTPKKVRELLCHKCNRGLGCFNERPDLLRLAAVYVEKHT